MSKTVADYLKLPYTIELKPEPEGGWFVSVKELPGCMSEGDTPDEALAMIQDAMQGWMTVALEDGDPIPEPRSDEDYSGKFVVRVPHSLHRQLVETAEAEGVSLNQYVNVALAGATGRAGVKPVAAPTAAMAHEPGWPGLSSAARQVLQAAGLAAEAGQHDERLVADWFKSTFALCMQDYRDGYVKDALRGLASLSAQCQQFARHSPALETLAASCQLTSQAIEQAWRLQQEAHDVHIRAQIRQEITQFYPQADQSILTEERRQYSAAATQPERDLAHSLFGAVIKTGSPQNDW